MSLITQGRLSNWCSARNTSPIPPAPIRFFSRYWPSCRAWKASLRRWPIVSTPNTAPIAETTSSSGTEVKCMAVAVLATLGHAQQITISITIGTTAIVPITAAARRIVFGMNSA